MKAVILMLQNAKRHGALKGIHRERKRPRSYSSYVSLLCDIINKEEPSSYEEATEKKEWKDAMIEEY